MKIMWGTGGVGTPRAEPWSFCFAAVVYMWVQRAPSANSTWNMKKSGACSRKSTAASIQNTVQHLFHCAFIYFLYSQNLCCLITNQISQVFNWRFGGQPFRVQFLFLIWWKDLGGTHVTNSWTVWVCLPSSLLENRVRKLLYFFPLRGIEFFTDS